MATRATKRWLAATTATAVLTAGLGGCTRSTGSYCDTLRDDRAQLEALSGQADKRGGDSLQRSLEVFEELRDAAPDDISDEWDTLVAAWQDLVDAVHRTGAPLSAFRGGKRPAGVSTADYRAVQQAAAGLAGTRVRQAGASIEQHALDVCKVDLGGGLG